MDQYNHEVLVILGRVARSSRKPIVGGRQFNTLRKQHLIRPWETERGVPISWDLTEGGWWVLQKHLETCDICREEFMNSRKYLIDAPLPEHPHA